MDDDDIIDESDLGVVVAFEQQCSPSDPFFPAPNPTRPLPQAVVSLGAVIPVFKEWGELQDLLYSEEAVKAGLDYDTVIKQTFKLIPKDEYIEYEQNTFKEHWPTIRLGG